MESQDILETEEKLEKKEGLLKTFLEWNKNSWKSGGKERWKVIVL